MTQPTPSPPVTVRILVVEDEYFIAQEIADTLRTAGFEVLGPCPSVPAALAAIEEGAACDLAVLDVSLRNATSLPVAEALRARGIPYVVVTGFAMSQLPAEMAAAPVLTKPISDAELLAAVRQVLADQ